MKIILVKLMIYISGSQPVLSLRHTNFDMKIGGTPNCKKRDRNAENLAVLHTFLEMLRFIGTPRKI
jgi:hypothetical protein